MTAHIDLSAWGAQPPLFVRLLASEVQRSNRTEAGRRIGMSRSTVTLVLANRYPSPSTAGVERCVLDALGRIDCVAIGEAITVEQCQTQCESRAPTHNPQALQRWKACQHCQLNPRALEASHARIQ
ncbi:hypothetical protein D3C76_418690 [compost metagenome]